MARAKAVRKPVEHMIQLAKDGGEHKKRAAMGYIYDKEVVDALFERRRRTAIETAGTLESFER